MFQSTHSLRSATTGCGSSTGEPVVSIHALLAECDPTCRTTIKPAGCFNPRTPCGVRPIIRVLTPVPASFQSTHSLRSATPASPRRPCDHRFQSTHSLRSATGVLLPAYIPGAGFNPRTPCGVRLPRTSFSLSRTGFQSTHSLRSAT